MTEDQKRPDDRRSAGERRRVADRGRAGRRGNRCAIPMPEARDREPSRSDSAPAGDAASAPTETPHLAAPSDTSLPQLPDTPPQGVPQNVRVRRRVPTPWARWPATPSSGHRRPINTAARRQTRTRRSGRPLQPLRRAGHRDNRLRNGLIAGGAALVVLAAGIGIGHATWNNGTQIPSASSSNNNQFPRMATAPIRSATGPCQTPGNSATPAAGTPDRPRRARPAPVTSTPLPTRSTRAWSTSTRRSATSRSRRPAPASS